MSNSDLPELDLVLSVLSDRRARFICYYLLADDIAEVNELYLAREVAAWETGIEPSQVPTETTTQMLETLQDDLLPRLDTARFVTYHAGKGTVRYGNPPEQLSRLVTLCRSIEQPSVTEGDRERGTR
jgi:hypothetical protein